MVKRILPILFVILLVMCVSGCDSSSFERKPQPDTNHLYWKDIDVVVTEYGYSQWFAGYTHKKIHITVKNDEYGLEKSFDLNDSQCDSYTFTKVGDTITATMYTWKNNETDTVNRREIHCLEYA